MRKLKLTLLVAIMSISTFGFADNHADSSEAEVLKVLSAYMDARNTRDFKAVIAMSSKAGTLDTNSDGSFHKPQIKQTIEGWEKSGDAIAQYYYPEATAITDDVREKKTRAMKIDPRKHKTEERYKNENCHPRKKEDKLP